MFGKAPKNFDCRRFVRQARAEIEIETVGMSPVQIVEYYRAYPYETPHKEIDATRQPWQQINGEKADGRFDCISYVRWARSKRTQKMNRPSAEPTRID